MNFKTNKWAVLFLLPIFTACLDQSGSVLKDSKKPKKTISYNRNSSTSTATATKKSKSHHEERKIAEQPQSKSVVKIRQTYPAQRGFIFDRYYNPELITNSDLVTNGSFEKGGQNFYRNYAYNKTAYYLAIDFQPIFHEKNKEKVMRFVNDRIKWINRTLNRKTDLVGDEAWSYFEKRRWIPMRVSDILTEADLKALEPVQFPQGLDWYPVWLRVYPQKKVAGNIIGMLKKVTGWHTSTPLVESDSVWPQMTGRGGMEAKFEDILKGEAGIIEKSYDANGRFLGESLAKTPKPGDSLVLTLDGGLQAIAKNILEKRARKGAFVVIDIDTMEVLAMESNPAFDPNDFVPALSAEVEAKIYQDEDRPYFARAFQEAYPPASTFKLPMALAGLEAGLIDEHSVYKCLSHVDYNGTIMRNWTAGDRNHPDHNKDFTAIDAIKRSCNTWFFQMANDLYQMKMANGERGLQTLFRLTNWLGFGAVSSLGLGAEQPGKMFSSLSEFKDSEGRVRGLGPGEVANISIGQGDLLATPLQIAQMSARIASPYSRTNLSILKGVVDVNGEMTSVAKPVVSEGFLSRVSPRNLEIIKRAMLAVTDGSQEGTGVEANVDYMTIAGKTGTAQWGKSRHVGIFTGFAPAERPKYAFVALYEGSEGQKIEYRDGSLHDVSGGHEAAPMVREFFNHQYVRELLAPYTGRLRAEPVTEMVEQPAVQPRKTKKQKGPGLLKRFLNR